MLHSRSCSLGGRSGRRLAWVAIGLLLALIAGFGGRHAVAASRDAELNSLMYQLGLTTPSTQGTPAELRSAVLRRLGEVQAAVHRCNVALPGAFAGKTADQVLRGIKQGAGQTVTVSEATYAALEKAAGGDLGVSQADLDLCVRARDMDIGGLPTSQVLTMAQIDRTLRRCLSLARSGVPNQPAFDVITSLVQQPGSDSFTKSDTVAALNRAYGRSTGLSRVDLEACAAAYDMSVTAGLARGENYGNLKGPFCDPDTQSTCVGTDGSWTCCNRSDSVCGHICSPQGGDCVAYCAQKWSCFPGAATVVTENGGSKAMRDVQIGDRVQVVRADGTLGFDDVYLMTHHDAVASRPYVELTLDSGRRLRLSPRHFIPVASAVATRWEDAVVRGADEVMPGDSVWYRDDAGGLRSAKVTGTATLVATGAFNPLTLGGTIVVDGVAASAHSDWFLDGWVSAATQATAYQALFAPVRALYALIGADWTRRISQDWGVVDAVRDGSPGLGFALCAVVVLLLGVGTAVARRRRALAG